MIDTITLKREAAELRSEIQNAKQRLLPKGRITEGEIRAVENRRALAELMEGTVEHEARLATLEQRSGRAVEPSKWTGGFGEFLHAIHRAGSPQGARDQRLEVRAAAGLGEQVPADGGFAVPYEFSTRLMELITYESMVASRCMSIPLTRGNTIKLPGIDEQSRADGSRWGGISSSWLVEGGSLPLGKPKFRNVDLTLNKLAAGCYATDELIQDTGALAAFAAIGLTLEGAYRLDEAVIRGTGAGQPQGILNSPALITIAKESGQAAATIVPQNIVGMFERMLPESRRNAVWFVGPELEARLYTMPLTVGTAGSSIELFTEADDAAPWGRLMNRPVIPVEQCSTVGAVGDIIFADPNRYLIAQKPLNIALSMHVRFVYDEGLFRMTFRVDGQSALATAITPVSGGPTKSAFVTLAARS